MTKFAASKIFDRMPQTPSQFARVILTLFIFSSVAISACGPSTPGGAFSKRENSAIKLDMQDIYRPAYELFTRAWNPAQFSSPEERVRIDSLLKTLSKDFHNVAKSRDSQLNDPGVDVTLQVTRRLLAQAERSFSAGRIDYARWKVKGIAHTCVSCHTRTPPNSPFFGAAPVAEPENYESAMNGIEFLIASRQFDLASERLLSLSSRSAEQIQGNFLTIARLWLLLNVRVLPESAQTREQLERLWQSPAVTKESFRLLLHWKTEIEKARMDITPPSISKAEKLLSEVMKSSRITSDDWNLVGTLRASSMLHRLLQDPSLSESDRRQATFLVAVCYQHMNIPIFAELRDLYLEKAIRTYPHTQEAKKAFEIFDSNVKALSSGSGGTHLDEEDQAIILELKKMSE